MLKASHCESDEKTCLRSERGDLGGARGDIGDAQFVVAVRAIDAVGQPLAVGRQAAAGSAARRRARRLRRIRLAFPTGRNRRAWEEVWFVQ